MKLFGFMIFLFGLGAVIFIAGHTAYTHWQQDSATIADTTVTYRKLANGATVIEERPGQIPVEDIEPAAGPNGLPAGNFRFLYDPLTQTYRAATVDRDGKSGQDIIRHSNP